MRNWIEPISKKVLTAFDRVLSRVPGGIFGILSVTIGVCGDFISIYLYPGYNIFINTISELGVGPGKIFFNIGVIFAGIIAIPFGIYLGRALNTKGSYEKLNKSAVVISIISCVSLSLIGVFPGNPAETLIYLLHGFCAFLCFFGGMIYLFLFSFLMLREPKFSKFLAYYGFFVAGLFLLFLFTWVPITEWIANIGIISWTIICSIYMLYKKI